MKINTLLLDRDGTLIEEKHYLHDPAQVKLLSGARALALWKRAGGKVFLVSNQSGIGRGYFDEEALAACNARLRELLQEQGGDLDGMRHCPHAPQEACHCRKPGIGMWQSLQEAFGLRAEKSAMVGDKPEDLGLAVNAGLSLAFLVLTGHGQESAAKLGLKLEAGQSCRAIGPEELPPALQGTTQVFLAQNLEEVMIFLHDYN